MKNLCCIITCLVAISCAKRQSSTVANHPSEAVSSSKSSDLTGGQCQFYVSGNVQTSSGQRLDNAVIKVQQGFAGYAPGGTYFVSWVDYACYTPAAGVEVCASYPGYIEKCEQVTAQDGFQVMQNYSLTLEPPPPAPVNIQAVSTFSDILTISWASGGGYTSSYAVAWAKGISVSLSCASAIDVGAVNSYTIRGLDEQSSYSLLVCAKNSGGVLSAGGAALSARTISRAQNPTSLQLACSSSSSQYAECQALKVVTAISLIKQDSQAACTINQSFGFKPGTNIVWVNRGCRGTFMATVDPNSMGAPGNLPGLEQWPLVVYGDFDGDSKLDIAGRSKDGMWRVGRISAESVLTSSVWGSWSPAVTWKYETVGDINGDGKDDIVGLEGSNWWAAVSTGTAFNNKYLGRWPETGDVSEIALAKVNRDTKYDLIWRNKNTFRAGISNGETFAFKDLISYSSAVNWVDGMFADFNGDGFVDLVAREGSNWWVSYILDTGGFSTFLASSWSTAVQWRFPRALDRTGDKRADIVSLEQGVMTGVRGGNFWTAASTISGKYNTTFYATLTPDRDYLQVLTGDFNGDQREDILGVRTDGVLECLLNNSAPASTFGTLAGVADLRNFRVADFNGDQRADLIYRNARTNRWTVAISSGSAFLNREVGGW